MCTVVELVVKNSIRISFHVPQWFIDVPKLSAIGSGVGKQLEGLVGDHSLHVNSGDSEFSKSADRYSLNVHQLVYVVKE